jgi:site-specific recombinase XerD
LDKTLNCLRRYLENRRPEPPRAELFSVARAPYSPVSHGSINQLFKNRVRKAGLPLAHASPYALRHSFAMRLFARGVGIKAIGDLMGHSGLVSTIVYLRLQTKMLREVALPVPRTVVLPGGAA